MARTNAAVADAQNGLDEMIEELGPASTAVAVPEDEQPTDVAVRTYSNTAVFDQEDMQIPSIRLAQGLTAEVERGEARQGQYIFSGETPLETLTLIPVGVAVTRELRDAEEGKRLLCQSPDSVQGFGDPGGACATCPLAAWGKDSKTGKGIPPRCSKVYSYIVYALEWDTIAKIDLKKSAANAAKQMNAHLALRGMGNVAFRFSSQSTKGPRGTFYTPVVVPTKVEQEVLARASERYSF